ncbi:SDR family NAD(P)-dependent oxidoreductase [Pararhodobacter sp.]|uniref:SDR family NAD(P)-dependent oxidoreductase n=1 Tax=Pararhodobacter sp. TaxID=2127056 RepID=UPI002B001770|nr:SDR family NAD(P)-dependent oxidoreductase [Pararhodobacter sp.]
MNSLTRAILITGCSSGIGYHCAHALRTRGWRVFASCRKQADCDRLIAEGFDSPRIDQADAASLETGLAQVLAATGGTLDALFNNGAFACPGAVEDLPTDALRETFETNFFGVHELTRRVIPVMRAQGHGRIVQNSSVLGYTPYRWRGAYGASKFALEGLTRILHLELSDTPIKVVLIQPGPIRSAFRRNAIPHFERWINWQNSARAAQYRDVLIPHLYDDSGKKNAFELGPEAVAKVLFKALDHPNPRARYIVTTPAKAIAWAQRLLPERLLNAFLARQ